MWCTSRSGDARRPIKSLGVGLRTSTEVELRLCLTECPLFLRRTGKCCWFRCSSGAYPRWLPSTSWSWCWRAPAEDQPAPCSGGTPTPWPPSAIQVSLFSCPLSNCAPVEITGVHLSEWCRLAPARFNYQHHMTHSNCTQCCFSHLYLFMSLLNRQPDFCSRFSMPYRYLY